jgi:predicted O-linked N-acetylglucosamine transferase (SPINDLY family)
VSPAAVRSPTTAVAEAVTHHQAGRLPEAAALYREALAADPEHPDALHLLGVLACDCGDLEAAEVLLGEATRIEPGIAQFHGDQGLALLLAGRPLEAVECLERALALDPDYADARTNLGSALHALGRYGDAAASFERALTLRPNAAEAHNNLGATLRAQGRLTEAIARYWVALAFRADYPEAHNNLGNALSERGEVDAAITCFAHALALRPGYAEAHNNLGNVLRDAGRLPEALAAYRRALELRPDYPAAHSNLIFALDLDPAVTSAAAFAERQRWDARYARPHAAAGARHDNDRDPDRPLRIGYVSADFRRHSAAAVFGPVLHHHDRGSVEVVCYAGVSNPDDVTARFRQRASLWRPTLGMPDDALAARIRADRVDILVDLAGHSAGNRLLAFARKPAPIQVTAWGHAHGTGLQAMDYFFADAVTVPAAHRGDFSETVVDLPCIVCFDPPSAPDVEPLPALAARGATFGCLNRLAKVTDDMLDLWATILREAPASRLLLKDPTLDSANVRDRLVAFFGGRGVAAERLILLGGTPHREHLAAYGRVDLALDPFPHGGGVTALEGLWMGVPMVALAGERVPSRIGAAFLTLMGLPDLVADSPRAYIDIAVRAAGDVARLAPARADLRRRLAASPLCDHRAYCAAVEAAYRAMWRRWCGGEGPGPLEPLGG